MTPRDRTRRAIVVGDIDLVRPLGLAGISSAVVAPASEPARWSRWTDAWVPDDPEQLLARLRSLAQRDDAALAFLPGRDAAVRLGTRHHDELRSFCAVGLPQPDLALELLDKARFQVLAERLGLPVPDSELVRAGADPARARFPVLVKPVGRDDRWFRAVGWGKAVEVRGHDEWTALRRRLEEPGIDVLVQELIPGSEDRIESYHAYVALDGRTLGSFTGRKLRTLPRSFGMSTALITTEAEDVAEMGRTVVARLGLLGAVKVDLKRGPDGRLHVLEVNPRLSLWAHLGAVAGVNLPALMHADLTGGRPAPAGRARPGVTWCEPRADLMAARQAGVPLRRWLRWVARCDVRSGYDLRDPMPVVQGKLWPRLAGRRRLLGTA